MSLPIRHRSTAYRLLARASLGAVCLSSLAMLGVASASSHREAPSIGGMPRVDASDFYLFRSYEGGRSDYVTLIANYQPMQDPSGGPNFYPLDPNALYEIHVDNNGDAKEDVTFQFRFTNTLANGGRGLAIAVGPNTIGIPLVQAGPVARVADSNLNMSESYTVTIVRGDRRAGTTAALVKSGTTIRTFEKPVDYIGVKTLGATAAYESYASQHIHSITIPGCPTGKDSGRVFVGQRQEPIAVSLGTVFDLVNATPATLLDASKVNALASTSLQGKNVTTLALEVHKDCLTNGTDPVIGAWTTASVRQSQIVAPKPKSGLNTAVLAGGAWTQVSRLGNPLVNELVVPLADKDAFNASKPTGDAQFLNAVAYPTLPALLGSVLSNNARAFAPTSLPRTDLLQVFLTGIVSVNRPQQTAAVPMVVPSDMLRLNTAIAPASAAQQNRLGLLGEIVRVNGVANLSTAVDLAGFPNGRRPKDDVVDIALAAMLGGLCVVNTNADLTRVVEGQTLNTNVLGLNTFALGGAANSSLSSDCGVRNVPLGLGVFNIHDGVDQAAVPLRSSFPYLNTPTAGSR